MPPAKANVVRIVGGRCRGSLVRFPSNATLRPTPDRVRETLFNWLGQDLTGAATLELYAGSGALSLESLSRGANLAVAIDRDPRLVRAIRDNAARLELAGLETHRADAESYLRAEARRFDVVFLDPPFADDRWPELLPACAARLSENGAIYAEAAHMIDPPQSLVVARSARAGQVYYHLLRLA